MDWSFGKVFTQAMNNAMQSEAERKKQMMDYNLNVDNLNLQKWQAYNQLNLENAKFNEANNQFGLTRADAYNRDTWNREWEVGKFNKETKRFFDTNMVNVDDNFVNAYQQTYESPYPGLKGYTPLGFISMYQTGGKENLGKTLEREGFRVQENIAALDNATKLKINADNLAFEDRWNKAKTQEERDIIVRERDQKARGIVMYKVEKGQLTFMTKTPRNYDDYVWSLSNGWTTPDIWQARNNVGAVRGIDDKNYNNIPESYDGRPD